MAATFNFNTSGKISQPTAEEWASADQDSAIISLSTGFQADGMPYYAYIAVKPSKYGEFYRLSKQRQSLDLEHYGSIIAAGPESEPPLPVTDRMVTEYGFDENFKKDLNAEFQKDRGKFAVAHEDKRLMAIVAMMKAKKPESH